MGSSWIPPSQENKMPPGVLNAPGGIHHLHGFADDAIGASSSDCSQNIRMLTDFCIADLYETSNARLIIRNETISKLECVHSSASRLIKSSNSSAPQEKTPTQVV
jgi:hypothetical protein